MPPSHSIVTTRVGESRRIELGGLNRSRGVLRLLGNRPSATRQQSGGIEDESQFRRNMDEGRPERGEHPEGRNEYSKRINQERSVEILHDDAATAAREAQRF